MTTVSAIGEHELLARILARLPRVSSSVLVGPGDDAAVIAPVRNEQLVVTTDAMVEGVHFTRAFSSAADIGHRALAVNLSDLAAMGATPRWALLSLVLPGSLPVTEVDDLVEGVSRLAARHDVAIAGGNITRTDGAMVIDVTAGGSVRPRRWLTRGGARPGHEIWLSGTIGGAAAGLQMLKQRSGIAAIAVDTGDEAPENRCIDRHRRPEPRVRLGMAMARARVASAAMDLSDGLADALRQVAAASGVGLRVDAAALPIESAAREWWTERGVDPVTAAAGGSDDYELLFAVPARSGRALQAVARQVAEPLTKIGVFTKDPSELVMVDGARTMALPEGFEHFAHR
ncbi:MAG TPA: thiamine-phosphate kinase [Vicinamibacterales bacterium]|nr:thiamine-phosphate kinase [Vicinamibacterales bacterium]